MSEFTLIYVCLAGITVVALVCLGIQVRLVGRLRKLDADNLKLAKRVSEQEHRVEVMYESMHELRAGTLGVGNKVKTLTVNLEQTREKLEELANMDPDNRLYSKAAKLVNSGASVEELMEECELPRAEAELLFSLHKQG